MNDNQENEELTEVEPRTSDKLSGEDVCEFSDFSHSEEDTPHLSTEDEVEQGTDESNVDAPLPGLQSLTDSAFIDDDAPAPVDVPVMDATPIDNLASQNDNDEDKPNKSHALRNALVSLAVVIVLAFAGFCGWLVFDDSQNASCHVPQGVTLDGVDVSGCSAAEVSSLVKKTIREGLSGDTVLHVGDDKEYHFNIAQMGSIDVDATVDAVMGTINPSLPSRCLERALALFGVASSPEPRELTTVCSLNKKKVKARVQEIADELDSDARDAGYVFNTEKRKVETVSAKTGYEVDVKKTTKAILNASTEGSASVDAVATVTKPEKTELGQAIYVDLNECHLYFYVDGKVKKDYPCTPGKSGYSTPTGSWYLEYKDPSPVWINPHSDWSKNMPETIQPGETNPLGLRALAVSCGGGIYIHGTTNTSELGTKASHGCVRLANANVVELYDLVETGIPIFIY